MSTFEQLQQKAPNVWEIPARYRPDMRVPARIFANRPILEAIAEDRSLDQLVNVATLPGIQGAALAMPDIHQGYGFPIGGIAATKYPDGAISPGGIGYDINCGVRLLTSNVQYEEVKDRIQPLSKQLYKEVPSGEGQDGPLKLNRKQMQGVLAEGARWMVEHGKGTEADLQHTESKGTFPGAAPDKVSKKAIKRGRTQLGTIGGGNHFAEVDRIDQIFDKETARAYGLAPGQLVVLIHTGSRGLGHQTATEYIRTFLNVQEKYDIRLPDRGLACVPLSSEEGQAYYGAMGAAANYAWANRQVVTWEMRKAFRKVLGEGAHLNVLYDVAHNIAKIESHQINDHSQKVIVHRKGATRAFGPKFVEEGSIFRKVGQPVLIPGSMGTSNYILAGTDKSTELSLGSSCHGAGRRMSRRAAHKKTKNRDLIGELKKQGIHVHAGSRKGVTEEAPLAYKDVHSIVDVVHDLGIVKKVANFKPVAVIKG
jgi:tRNA-splicing ligase RtcB